jgi:hypothetical protein
MKQRQRRAHFLVLLVQSQRSPALLIALLSERSVSMFAECENFLPNCRVSIPPSKRRSNDPVR